MLKNRERLLISLPPELKQWAQDEAQKAGTSVAKYVESVLEQKRAEGDVPRRKDRPFKAKEDWFLS